ncbi:MAG: porin family protein [Prevotella sp.]|jgi:hypothetical protein|nr:porin family protein [Prevotella sp.]
MNKYIFTLLPALLSFALNVTAQDNTNKYPRNEIGIYSAIGSNDLIRLESIEGDGSYNNDGLVAIGLNYIYGINRKFDLETGVEYSNHNIIYKPPYMGEGFDYSQKKKKFKLITIPLTARFNFWRYFFLNGGALIDFDLSDNDGYIDKQTGIGATLGLGAKYEFSFGLTAYINPYLKLHTLIPFSAERYHQRARESSIRLGVTYKLKK